MTHPLILVVDDHKSIATSLSLVLHRFGYECELAYSGEEALQVAESNPPELLITDFMMPGMNGCELADQFRSRFPDCKIILHTGNTIGSTVPYLVLRKPVQPEVMLGEIRHLFA